MTVSLPLPARNHLLVAAAAALLLAAACGGGSSSSDDVAQPPGGDVAAPDAATPDGTAGDDAVAADAAPDSTAADATAADATVDACPDDPDKTAPGVCGCGTPDTDGDEDGTADCDDGCPADPDKTAPGACGCGTPDTDGDEDGTADCDDGCPADPGKTAPGVCGCGTADTDGDEDGTADCEDGCPTDAGKTAPGVCGCGTADTDGDEDGTADCDDACPADAAKTNPGLCGCGAADTDGDEDGTPDCHDGCPADPAKTVPGDCGCGVADTDGDEDGTPDCEDGCPGDPAKVRPGDCGCGEADTDGDGDGTADCVDGCPDDANKTAPGSCGCGERETDGDDDGTPDCVDDCPADGNKTAPGLCGCGVADTNGDGDALPDCQDGCPADPDKTEPGDCGCGVPETPSCDELDPPTPDPLTWSVLPHATGTTSIEMAATAAVDPNGVAYYFECVSGPCHDSGWQDAPTYVDEGLAPDRACTYRVKARDGSRNANETGWSNEAVARTDRDGAYAAGVEARYFDYETRLVSIPALVGRTPDVERIEADIAWAATTEPWPGLDERFADTFAARFAGFLRVETAGSYTIFLDAGDGAKLWLGGRLLIDNDGAHPMRERSAVETLAAGYHPVRIDYFEDIDEAGLVVSWAGPVGERAPIPPTAWYHLDPRDGTPPAPSPAAWLAAPAPTGTTSVAMTAAAAADPSGVQYYFACALGDCHDSGWQHEATYEDTGLTPGTQYGYRVATRDLSLLENVGEWSPAEACVTDAVVPDVVDTTLSAAQSTLTGAALASGAVTTEYSETIAAGRVVRQDPAAGAEVAAGTRVDLVISLGPPMVTVPDVVGLDEAAAAAAIADAGLAVGDVTLAVSNLVAPGEVMAQDPAAGTPAPPGAVVALQVCQGPAIVVINEIMYHPAIDYAGEEFLELHNPADYAIPLAGWTIEGLGGFTFGADAVIEAGAFLVLAEDAAAFELAYGFAPDDVFVGGELSNAGETLRVVDGDGIVVDEVTWDDQAPWPILPDGQGPSLELIDAALDNDTPRNWHASTDAFGHTAGAPNSVAADGLPPWISDVRHDAAPDIPILVTAVVEDATEVSLTYVIDWGAPQTIPLLDDGLSGDDLVGDLVYGAAIPAQPVNTIIRYRIEATGPGGTMTWPRDDDTVVYTGTYLVDPTITSTLPVFHWLMDPADYAAALSHFRTDETEPALVFHDGVLYTGVQVRVRGQSSRGWPKKHWKFFFPHGNEFYREGLIAQPVDQFNMQSNYSDKTYMREVLSYGTFRDAGAPSHEVFPANLYQNGAFYGLYTYLESKDATWLDRNDVDGDGALYKAFSQCEFIPLANLPSRFEKQSPQDGDYQDLFALLDGINNLSGQARKDFIFDNVDIPGMLNYLAATCLIHNNDHPAKNYYLYRDTDGTGRWVMFAWDMDLTFGRSFQGAVLNDRMFAADDDVGRTNVSPSHPLFGDSEHQKWDYLWNRFIDALYEDPEIREMYYRRLRTLMDALLLPGRYEAQIDAIAPLLTDLAEQDRLKWGQYGESQTLATAVTHLKDDYLAIRRAHLFETHRVPGEIPAAQSLRPQVVINEIMYHPFEDPAVEGDPLADAEFVELYNPSPDESVDVSGWVLDGVRMTLPPGTVILPDDYLVVVRDDPFFRAEYGGGRFVVGSYDGRLDNGGERLALLDRAGRLVDEVTYDDAAPWPVDPDGGGPSLELIDAALDNSRADVWAPSETAGGTPGAPNSVIWMAP